LVSVCFALFMHAIQKGTSLNSKSGVSVFVSGRTVIAYWLIPAEPARSFFQGMINDLARRYNAPLFEPHVTIHVGANHIDVAEHALSKAARECQSITVKTLGIDHSDEFIKTLFVQFALNTKLQQLNAILCTAAEDSSDYKLNPHLSLLYKKITPVVRSELADSINVPFSEVVFDTLQAVRCISPMQNRADVEAWRAITRRSLRSIGV